MRVIDEGFVYDARLAPPTRCSCCFTNVCILADGKILVMFRAGSSKDSADENLILRCSTDQGKHWTTIFERFDPIVDGVSGSWRYGAISELEPGNLLGVFNWFDRSDPKLPLANPVTEGILPSRIFILELRESEQSWTRRREINPKPLEAMALTGPMLKLSNGGLAAQYECWKSYHDTKPGKHHAVLRVSHDNAWTFGPSIITGHDPSGRLFFYDQRLAVDSQRGRLVAAFWTYDRSAKRDANIHIAWGSPDGAGWTYPIDTGIAGQIASPLALPDGKLLLTYVHRHDPPSLRAVLSANFGKTWDLEHELTFYNSNVKEAGMGESREAEDFWRDMGRWTFGHPEGRALSDGTIFVAYYAGNKGFLSLRWARLDVNE